MQTNRYRDCRFAIAATWVCVLTVVFPSLLLPLVFAQNRPSDYRTFSPSTPTATATQTHPAPPPGRAIIESAVGGYKTLTPAATVGPSSPPPVAIPPKPEPPAASAPPPAPVKKWDIEWLKPTSWHWRFEIFFGGALSLVILWMLGVRWVHQDAINRRLSHEFWTSLAVFGFLPGILIYAVASRIKPKTSPRDAVPGAGEIFDALRVEKTTSALPLLEILDDDGKPILIVIKEKGENVLPIVKDILRRALEAGASDLHLEPAAGEFKVRYRVDGEFRQTETLPKATGVRVVSSFKSLASIDVADKRRAQDGSFRVRCGDLEMDLRAATSNTIHGETMVIRLLSLTSGQRTLSEIGLSLKDEQTVREALNRSSGMILIAGPTASGKTSTAYAALSLFEPREKKIMTIEDPVEYRLKGATQIPVNPAAGMTYEEGLQAVLRQDPDIIFVGEMRNRKATEAAISAALTGRLVITTLHATTAAGTIVRLRDMGIEPYQIASAVSLVIAQRLVPTICELCREQYRPSAEELADLGERAAGLERLWRGKGCDACAHQGVTGRIGIFEVLRVTPEIKMAIVEKLPQEEIEVLAREAGMKTLAEDALSKVAAGIVPLSEVIKLL